MGRTGYKVQLLSPACGIQEVAAVHKYMPAAYTEPICLYPCSCTNVLIGAGQNHHCQPVIDVCKFLIVCSNLMMFPWGAQACTPENLELTVV